jgi:hypothetical protein
MSSLQLKVDKTAFDQIAGASQATEQQVTQAVTNSLRKLGKHIATIVKRETAKEARVPQKALGRRIYASPVNAGDSKMTVWVGTYAIEAVNVGTPTVYGVPGKSGGVKVGRMKYPGAFIAQIYTADKKVWIRKGSKHFSSDLYPTKRRGGSRLSAGLSGRFPVVRAAIPVDAIVERVFSENSAEFGDFFSKTFARELNFQVNVKGAAT